MAGGGSSEMKGLRVRLLDLQTAFDGLLEDHAMLVGRVESYRAVIQRCEERIVALEGQVAAANAPPSIPPLRGEGVRSAGQAAADGGSVGMVPAAPAAKRKGK